MEYPSTEYMSKLRHPPNRDLIRFDMIVYIDPAFNPGTNSTKVEKITMSQVVFKYSKYFWSFL